MLSRVYGQTLNCSHLFSSAEPLINRCIVEDLFSSAITDCTKSLILLKKRLLYTVFQFSLKL